MAEQTKAQKKRAEARERRRGQPPEDQSRENQDDGALAGNEEQPLDAVKQAAKVAVAGAAVGAAAAAARALTSRDDDSEPEPTSEPQAEQDQEPERQQEPEPEEKPAEQQPQDAMRERQDGTQERQDGTQEPEAQDAAPRVQSREERHGAAPDDAKATVKQAREQLEALLELPVESVSGFERTRNGWLVTLEVLELSRIPESTDVLASYEMELDDDRNLVRYTRGRRYHRSQADRGDQA